MKLSELLDAQPCPCCRRSGWMPIESHPEFDNFIRAFWRRIEPYKNDFNKELPEKIPIQFRVSMITAFLQLEKNNG